MKLSSRTVKKVKVKGFTLIELIIVIAIIGVLAGILAPTMSAYYTRSRLKSSNSEAKMVYNAAQTEAQKYITIDRVNPAGATSGLNGVFTIAYDPTSNSVSFGTAAGTSLSLGGFEVDSTIASPPADQPMALTAARIARAVTRTVSDADNKCWAIYIDNYIVKGCIAADQATSNLVGYYTAGKTFADSRTQNFTNWIANTSASEEVDTLDEVGVLYDSAD